MERLPGEKQNDRNDRAIRRAASWYSSHLSEDAVNGVFPRIVLLTDDENNRKLAQEEGIVCSTGWYLRIWRQKHAIDGHFEVVDLLPIT